jgi:hypothetical protein
MIYSQALCSGLENKPSNLLLRSAFIPLQNAKARGLSEFVSASMLKLILRAQDWDVGSTEGIVNYS